MMLRIVVTTVVVAALCFGQSKTTNPPGSQTTKANEGEKLFQQNCGRCHRPPDQLNPSTAGSVLRHMRVRAMLSKEDQQLILKYLAP